MSSIRDLNNSKRLMEWIGDDEENTLIAYSQDLSDYTTALMATIDNLTTTPEQQQVISKAASLMARLSIDMKTIHRELFTR